MRRDLLVLVLVVSVIAAGSWGIYEITRPVERGFRGIVPPEGPQEAPDFTPMDHNGGSVSLRDFRKKVVVLTFLYNHCPDYCPLITSKFMDIAEDYGETLGNDVVFVAITTDPKRDTADRITEYRNAYGFDGYLLTGSNETVAEVWEDYFVYMEYVDLGRNEKESSDLLGLPGQYGVNHTTKILLIDGDGMIRVVHLSAF
jgi:protein SCO1/2